MFVKLDDDNSGQVSEDEFKSMGEEDKNLLYSVLGVSDPLEIFHQLDVDESGLLEIDEFCDGIWQVAISKAPIELKRIEKQVNNLKNNVLEMRVSQSAIQELMETVLSSVNARMPQATEEKNEPKKDESKIHGLDAKLAGSKVLNAWLDGLDAKLAALRSSLSADLQEVSNQLKGGGVSLLNQEKQVLCVMKQKAVISLGEQGGEALSRDIPCLSTDMFQSTESLKSIVQDAVLSAKNSNLRALDSSADHLSPRTVTRESFGLGEPALPSLMIRPTWAEELQESMHREVGGLKDGLDKLLVRSKDHGSTLADLKKELSQRDKLSMI